MKTGTALSRQERIRVAFGFALSNTILLIYGLFRPDSVEFSIAFLIAPSMAVLWTVMQGAERPERRLALLVTWGTAIATIAVVAVNWIRG